MEECEDDVQGEAPLGVAGHIFSLVAAMWQGLF